MPTSKPDPNIPDKELSLEQLMQRYADNMWGACSLTFDGDCFHEQGHEWSACVRDINGIGTGSGTTPRDAILAAAKCFRENPELTAWAKAPRPSAEELMELLGDEATDEEILAIPSEPKQDDTEPYRPTKSQYDFGTNQSAIETETMRRDKDPDEDTNKHLASGYMDSVDYD